MWLGLERICQTVDDCAFNWVDNTSLDLTYVNWAQDEPSFSSKNEFCVEMLNDGFWNDVNCGSSRIW
ncbi:mannose-binding lectin 1, partial [Aphelenchoides avenae]